MRGFQRGYVLTEQPMQSTASARRSEAAARKRERSRRRILDAVSELCGHKRRGAIVIEDVLRRAEVSRGTFYAHFDSLASAMAAVTERLADDLRALLVDLYGDLDDPLLRIAVATQATLARSLTDPTWGKALVDARQLSPRAMDLLVESVVRGGEQSIFRFTDARAAVAVLLGTFIQAAVALQQMDGDPRLFIEEVTFLALRGLGAEEEGARDAVRRTSEDVHGRLRL